MNEFGLEQHGECTDDGGKRYKVGDTWVENCQTNTCNKDGRIDQMPVNCPSASGACSAPNSTLVVMPPSGVSCCPTYECECTDDDGKRYKPGDTWVSNCQKKTCNKDGSIDHRPVDCPPASGSCSTPNSTLVGMPPSGGSCCPTYECACFPGSCSLPQVSCQPGFRPEVTMEGCCPKISCVPKGVCVKDGIEYPPGSPIYTAPNSCYECNCTSMVSSSTLLHEMNCQAIICNTACDPGTKYEIIPGQCCGKCVQNGCVVILSTGEKVVLSDGHGIPDDNCTYYLCTQVNGFYVTSIKMGICEYNSIADCGPGQNFVKNPGECCGRCIQTQCVVIAANGTVILLKEKQTIASPDDRCLTYTCMISMGKLSAVKQLKSCEHQSQSDCGIGYQYQILPEQCCGKCVPTSCVYITPDGKTILLKESENWKSDNNCTTVTCQNINGQFLTSSVTKTCTYTSAKDCGLGYIYQTDPNQCCGTCVQRSCVFTTANGVFTTLEDGQTLPEPSDICTVYNCKKANGQFLTLAVKKTCEHVSAKDCQAGEQYQKVPGQCCGQCVQTQCLIIDAGGVNKTLNVGETWTSTSNACVSYGCTKSNGQIYSMLMNQTCQTLTSEECGSGTFQLSADGCCNKCIPPKACRAVNNITTLREKGCQLQENVPYCDGVCITNPNPMLSSGKDKPCVCCGIQKSNMRTVKLKCPDGKTNNYTYEYIKKCGCDTLMCSKP